MISRVPESQPEGRSPGHRSLVRSVKGPSWRLRFREPLKLWFPFKTRTNVV